MGFRARLDTTPKSKQSRAGQMPHFSKENTGLSSPSCRKETEAGAGDLPTVPLWGEDKSSGRGNSDLKADFGVTLCAGVLCLA